MAEAAWLCRTHPPCPAWAIGHAGHFHGACSMQKLGALVSRLLLVTAMAVLLFDAVVVGLHYQAYAIVVLLGITYRISRKRWSMSGAYGTAKFADLWDLFLGHMLCKRGLTLGRVGYASRPSRWQALRSLLSPRIPSEWAVKQFTAAWLGPRRAGDFIRIEDFVHLATFAPAGGGKSVSVLYPNLLSYEGNCVVVDPKGELFKLTHEHRKKQFGHTIVRLDPAMLYGPGDSFNVFDFIDPTRPDFIEVCRDIANMLVTRTGKEMDPHWTDSAENVICAIIAFICALEGDPAARNLTGARTQLTSRVNYTHALEVMQQQPGFYGVLEELGNSLQWHVDKELGSVMTHAQRFTNIFGAPLVAASTGSTTFDPKLLRSGRMTIYLITPADKMVTWASLQRLWLGSLIRIITRGVPTEKNPVLFLVDECAHIGKMQALEDAITLLRGAGIRLWLFFQSLEQVNKCFGDNAGTVLDNLATQQYFSITSLPTAKAVSERMGDETVVVRTDGDNRGHSSPVGGDGKSPGSRNSGSNTSFSEAARKLLKPEEILTLSKDVAIVFHQNNPVVLCTKVKHYADPAFRRRGILRRRWGTGRSPGMGMGGMVLGLAALALAYAVTMLVDSMPVPVRRPRAAATADGDAEGGAMPVNAPYGAGMSRPVPAPSNHWGRHSLPYGQRSRSGFSQ
jgi:type IV secretion system protein VirD4